jgi:hypothetical protein
LGAGPAFESDASHYERDELPHTLACHKIISTIIDFPTSTAYDFYSVICIFVSLAFISTITLPAYLFIYTLVLFWRREVRTVGSSKGCLPDYISKEHYLLYRYILLCPEKSATFFTFFRT